MKITYKAPNAYGSKFRRRMTVAEGMGTVSAKQGPWFGAANGKTQYGEQHVAGTRSHMITETVPTDMVGLV